MLIYSLRVDRTACEVHNYSAAKYQDTSFVVLNLFVFSYLRLTYPSIEGCIFTCIDLIAFAKTVFWYIVIVMLDMDMVVPMIAACITGM